MNDYISRDDVRSMILKYRADNPKKQTVWAMVISDMLRDLKEIPAADVQPAKRGSWITKAEDYYKAWQDSGRSWDDMPYFVTGLKFACSNCFEQYDVNAEGVEKWNGCPLCLARMKED